MNSKKSSKFGRLGAIFGVFLVFISMLFSVGCTVISSSEVYAVTSQSEQVVEEGDSEDREEALNAIEDMDEEVLDETEEQESAKSQNVDGCKSSLGALGWLVCPTTGKIAEAVDWLYDKIEDILVIRPISTEDGTPVYEIWKYFLGFSNIAFIIFLLIVIYSQITGLGISNYGVKKTLPKLIVMAIVVNLSFLICLLAIDVSNILGNSLRGLFTAVEEAAVQSSTMEGDAATYASLYSSLAGGTALAIGGGVIAFELGAIWMLIPTVLGAIVAVATGLITIALRQAVVVLLVMVSPLAIVASILPNTEKWFQKWKELLMKMLIFYPMFSLLFGASSLAGFAIIMSAKDGFGLMLGMAVQIFPLFFSWKLMQMSGTFLSGINMRLRGLAARPLMANRAWAGSHMMNSRMKHLASERPITPSLRLMQFMANRRIEREMDTHDNMELTKARGMDYRARRNFTKDGMMPSKRGEQAYERQARALEYQQMIARNAHTMNKGLSYMAANGTADKVRLKQLDDRMVNAADMLKVEQARGEKIEYENALGFHQRMDDAINAHMDYTAGFETDKDGNRKPRSNYKFHFNPNNLEQTEAMARYNTMYQLMENNVADVQFAAATAAQGYDTQKKIVETKMQKYFDMTAPTQDVVHRLNEMTRLPKERLQMGITAGDNIDVILSGMRILNQRGDTDLVKEQMDNLLSKDIGGGIQLGTHASQALASFLMFEVKDNDPWIRRFGKYINLETARVYNKNKRQVLDITYDEYVKGYHDEPDLENPGQVKRMYAKKGMKELMQGTPIDNIERTALSNYDDSLIKVYTDERGKLDYEGYIKKRQEVDEAFGPAFISASLKYLSGSEQIASAVRAKTGYTAEQKEDGTYEMVPIWETGDYAKLFAGHEKDIEKWYREGTLKYLADQTPFQILGLRSDYRVPLSEHLANAYMNSDMKDWSDEAIEERKGIMTEWAELQTKYGDLSTDEAKKNYRAEADVLRKKMVGAQFRQVLDSKGKLNQIYRTRRSGAANNAKDWVRDWLDLDNELKVTMKLEDDKRKSKAVEKNKKKSKNPTNSEQAADDAVSGGSSVYTDVDRASFVNSVEDLWYEMRDEDDDAFYEESMNYLKKTLGDESYIVGQYEQFRKDDPYADSHMLKEFILSLLNDPSNY